jgi:hypothetical protein
MRRLPPDWMQPSLRAQSFPSDRRCRLLSASAIQHSALLRLSMIARSHVGLVGSKRADSQSLSLARSRNYRMCENAGSVADTKQKKRSCNVVESFVLEKHSLRINVAPEQLAKWFSHGRDPMQTSSQLLTRKPLRRLVGRARRQPHSSAPGRFRELHVVVTQAARRDNFERRRF